MLQVSIPGVPGKAKNAHVVWFYILGSKKRMDRNPGVKSQLLHPAEFGVHFRSGPGDSNPTATRTQKNKQKRQTKSNSSEADTITVLKGDTPREAHRAQRRHMKGDKAKEADTTTDMTKNIWETNEGSQGQRSRHHH